MAVDDRESPDESGELPRRIPGANGRTPGQIRRGYLPIPGPAGLVRRAQAASAVSVTETDQTEARVEVPVPAVEQLPRRAPGGSPIQTPQKELRRHQLPQPLSRESMAAPSPSPTALASSAAKLLTATAAPPEVASLPRSTSPSGTPPPPADSQIADQQATRPSQSLPGQRTARLARPARRWRIAGVLIAVVAMAGVALITLGFRHSPATKTGAARAPNSDTRQLATEAAVRTAAVTWVTGQVGRDIIIACDPVICSDLAQHGFPASNLNTLQPTAPDPYGSELVIATAGVRSQFGSKLADVYAPQVIASFGAGADKIDVRLIAPRGPAAFDAALRADLQASKSSGAQLLRNTKIQTSATARVQLAAGQVDSRLLTTIAFMAGQQPLDIVDFGSIAPGASPSVPLRFADLADFDQAAHLPGPAYQHALVTLAREAEPPYLPLYVGLVRLANGQTVVRIEFAAPSPAGLSS